ncbi:MAG: TSUP family transporter, partial [Bdellovibrionota bacterium]
EAFVATATAVGLIVDGARMPVYFFTQLGGIREHLSLIGIAVAGVLIGTVLGIRFLKHIPETEFRKVISVLILFLGGFMVYRGLGDLI